MKYEPPTPPKKKKTKLAVSNEISAMLKKDKPYYSSPAQKKVMKDRNTVYSTPGRRCQSKYVLMSKCLRLLTYCGYITPSDFPNIRPRRVADIFDSRYRMHERCRKAQMGR